MASLCNCRLVPLLLLAVRPHAVMPVLLGTRTRWTQRWLTSWFGSRGVGSSYYLMFAVNRGIAPPIAAQLIGLTLATVAVSIVAHGISVTPLMKLYQRASQRRGPPVPPRAAQRRSAPNRG